MSFFLSAVVLELSCIHPSNPHNDAEVSVMSIPILQMRQLRHREVKITQRPSRDLNEAAWFWIPYS